MAWYLNSFFFLIFDIKVHATKMKIGKLNYLRINNIYERLWTKMVTQEDFEFPSSHRHPELIATDGANPSERNREIS